MQVISVLQQGGVIAYPTEAVYGLGCDPDNIEAIKKILEIKNRPKEKGLILIASDFKQLAPYLQDLDQTIYDKMFLKWPGAVTYLVPVKENVTDYLTGNFTTLAVRVSAHPVVREICQAYGKPVVSTSANPAGKDPARTAQEVYDYQLDVDLVVEGETDVNANPSEIRDAISDEIIRAG